MLFVMYSRQVLCKMIQNEFSWSKSRDELFKECKRKYYFNYYGCWGGWDETAPERIRELYILKNLSTRQAWIGKTVHETIKNYLLQLKIGNDLSSSSITYQLKKKLKAEFEFSNAGNYRTFPKKVGLVEHEYKKIISKEEWDELFDYAEKCIINFYNSDALREIKKEPLENWLFLEDFLHFDFEGTKIYLSIDFAIKNSDNKIILYDWKTGKERDSEMDIQLACYALYVLQKWNLNPACITVDRYNVALDKEDRFNINSEVIEKIKSHMSDSIQKMKEILSDKTKNLAIESNFSKTTDIKKCLRCNFRKVCDIV